MWIVYDQGYSMGFQVSFVDHLFVVPVFRGLTPRGHHARLSTLIQSCFLPNTSVYLHGTTDLTLIYYRLVNAVITT